MVTRDIIVIGVSAGAILPLSSIIAALPANLPVTVFVILHSEIDPIVNLVALLEKAGSLPCDLAQDYEPVRPGRIYIARPDYHLLVIKGCLRLVKGLKDFYTGSTLDPLFRSAALEYGSRVVGVILSESLSDGNVALHAVKQGGGATIVQAPPDTWAPSYPTIC